ncbi:MAG: bifunctional 4-hydroxy-2-oxoglutarate aldolase/2-dehydro-3-deoxy-phosphogluconate aldolase [Anaerolineaceae bacterium]|nr:bifunctional 4-hydroxy-2-oxoglutarate aldolase/2-dehydro-3-deoxy-phosphogluconate aldolase [Anaerolineaceae bacterium]
MDYPMNNKEKVIYWTKSTGVLPAIKIKGSADMIPYIKAMVDGGAKVIEITTTTPGAFDHFRIISEYFGDALALASGTTLDETTARLAILAGVKIIVSPATIPAVIRTANRYGAAVFIGAFTATDVLTGMEAGADMIKIFPAALGGPKYMTNLRMVYPEVNLIPSGGISLETAGEFIRCGASAISGARNFFDLKMVEQHGLGWISEQVAKYIALVAEARQNLPQLP